MYIPQVAIYFLVESTVNPSSHSLDEMQHRRLILLKVYMLFVKQPVTESRLKKSQLSLVEEFSLLLMKEDIGSSYSQNLGYHPSRSLEKSLARHKDWIIANHWEFLLVKLYKSFQIKWR